MRVAEVATGTRARPGGFDEDAVAWLADPGIAVIADGLGGEGVGDVAATLAINAVERRAPALARLAEATVGDRSSGARLALGRTLDRLFQSIHEELAESAKARSIEGRAATLLAGVVAGGHLFLAHVGEARAYLLRGRSLRRLTEDHTVGMARVRKGVMSEDEYRQSPLRKRLYQALGTGSDVDVDLRQVAVADGDVVLLCSDGVHAWLDDDLIAGALARPTAQDAIDALLDGAAEAGTDDDASAVVFRIASEARPERLDAITSVLAETALFRPLTDADRLAVAPYLDHRDLAPNEVLFEEGDPGDAFYVVVDGRVRITVGATPLTEVGPGGGFGELCLARPVPRSATVTAVEPTLVLGLSRDRFHEVVSRRPKIGSRLVLTALDLLGDRLRDLTERLATVERIAVGEIRPGELGFRTAVQLAARGEWTDEAPLDATEETQS